MEIVKSKQFQENLIETLVNFAFQKNESKRTASDVKSIPVLLMQAYCLFQLPNLAGNVTVQAYKEIFENEA